MADGWHSLSEMTPVDGWHIDRIEAIAQDGVWELVRFRLRNQLTGNVESFYTTMENAEEISDALTSALTKG